MVEAGLAEGVVGRARTSGLIDIVVHNLRDYTTDKHHVVDDVPFGGGPGMVMKPEPFFAALAAIRERRGTPDAVVMLTPAGVPFTPGRRAAAGGAGAPRAAVRALRGHRRAGARGAGDRRVVDWRLRAVGRRDPGAGGGRRGGPAGAGRGRRRAVGGRGFVYARVARLPALHEARGVRGTEVPPCCCRGITERFAGGGATRRWSGRPNGGPTSWRTRRSTPMNKSG